MSEITKHDLRAFNPDDIRLRQLEKRVERLEERSEAMGEKMFKREKFEAYIFGAVAALGAVGGYLVKWLKGEQ